MISKELLRVYWQALEWFRFRAVSLVVLQALAGFLEGVALTTLVPILDTAILPGGGNSPWVKWLHPLGLSSSRLVVLGVASFVLLGFLSASVKLLADSGLLLLKTEIEESMRSRMTHALLGMDWSPFLSLRLGDISKAMVMEGLQTATGAHALLHGFSSLLIVSSFFVMAVIISPDMTIIAMLFSAIAGIGYRVVGEKAMVHARELSHIVSSIGEQITELFGNLKFFRATALAPQVREKATATYRQYAHYYFMSQISGIRMRFAFESGGVVFVGLFLIFSLLISKEPFTHSLAFLALFYRMAPRILSAQDSFYQAGTHQSWFLTWKKRLEQANDFQETSDGIKKPSFGKELSMHAVDFSYPGSDRLVLKRVSWVFGRGECLAIVGESGSGKSTILDLVTGLLKPNTGQICMDGQPLSEVKLDEWRSRIGLVIQDSPVFHATVLENIALGDSHPNRDRAQYCSELAYASQFIEKLPRGLDTEIGEKGGRISGGQRQRIALARALYRDPWLLILDEATSALDSDSESKIQEALTGLKGKLSILMVAHRIKTVQMADRILVLGQGSVLEQGTWEELITRQGGAFYKMAMLQGLVE
jgi:ABC-type multidrug transport system fused ATPase/permease subunit